MQIIWKGSPNKDGKEYREPITHVVLHWFGVGTLDGANNRFQNDTTDVSAHYGISDDTVYQWVKEEEVAWHAGNYAMNQCSIGIEHDATTTKNASDKTYQTAGQLLREICDRHNIPLDRAHILKHSEVVPTSCPGTLDVDKIIAIAKGESMLDKDIETAVEEQFKLKEIDRYNKYWTYEELIEDWVKLTKEVQNEENQKEEFEKLYKQYKETCTSQAEEIAKLGEEIKSLNQANAGYRSEIAQLQGQFAEVSRERDGLLDTCKGYESNLNRLRLENEDLQKKITSLNPLQAYSISDILTELVNRVFRKKVN